MNKRVLVVDDEESILDLVRRILEPEGYEVHTASKVEEAFELCKKIEPFLVLCDMRLENHVDGATLAGMIQRHNPYIVRICITGALEAFQKGYLIGSPFTDILMKPLDIKLLRRIARYANDKYERWKSY